MINDIYQQKNLNQTIFFIWNQRSDTFQTDAAFTRLFRITPSFFSDIKHLIFNEDSIKLESEVKESINGKNIVLPLRMKIYGQDYTWFTACFGRLEGDIVAGTLAPTCLDKLQSDYETKGLMYERMQLALQAANAGLWDWDTTTGKVHYDSRYIKMMGYQPSEFKDTLSSWSDRVHPDDYEETVQKQLDCMKDQSHGDFFTCKYRFLGADGNYRWIRGQGLVLDRDAHGKGLRMVGLHIDITEEEEAKMQLEFMVSHDMLTGLHSRYYFEHNLAKLDKNVLPAAYILVDADGLKMVNDCINHSAGDRMLQKLAATLRFSIRNSDLSARIGGDEFAIFLPRTPEHNALKVLQKIHDNIEAANQVDGAIITCASLGLACATTMDEVATLAMRADANMIKQKEKQKLDSLHRIKKWIESTGRSGNDYNDKRILKE